MTEPSTNQSTAQPASDRPPPPHLSSHALLGSASPMLRDPLGFLLETRRYGEVVGMRFVFSQAYLAYHPDDVKHVLQENHINYNKDVFTYQILRPVLGMGLFTNDGDSWLHQRRLMQPAFHHMRLDAYATLMTDAANAMVERWQAYVEAGEQLDIAEEMMSLTLGIVGQALFSIDLSHETSIVGQAVTTIVKLLGDYVYAPFPPLGVPTPRNRHITAAIHALDTVVSGIIRERRADSTDTGDLLSMLLLLRDEETGEGMNDHQVRDEVMTLLLAGHETTANTLTWTWYVLLSIRKSKVACMLSLVVCCAATRRWLSSFPICRIPRWSFRRRCGSIRRFGYSVARRSPTMSWGECPFRREAWSSSAPTRHIATQPSGSSRRYSIRSVLRPSE